MTPQEKSLIDSVFDRLAQGGAGAKDSEALAYIRDRAARLPDSVYGLVQAVLIQEMTINQAAAHVAELERQVAQGGAPAQGSSFLGGAGPWGQAPTRAAAPQPQAQPAYQPQQPQPQAGPWGAPASGGGFLRNMASMAAGVAGGTLLAEGISSLFGGRHLFGGGFGGIGGYGPLGGQPGMVENVTVNNYGDANAGGDSLPQADQAGYQDASFTDSGDDGSSFDGGDFGSDFSDT